MLRIADHEVERLKAEVSLVRLVESSGVTLAKRGADYAGACPFHADDTPSLVVSVAKNLFNCFGCGAGGGVIDWVMKREGVSFRHAVEVLRDGSPADAAARFSPSPRDGCASSPIKPTPTRKLAAPVTLDVDDQRLLAQVVDYYHETLKQSPEALAYLQSRGLSDGINGAELINRFRLGYANRTLGLRLPEKNRKAGAEVRGRLERVGIYRSSGHEHFAGSLVVPVMGPVDQGAPVTELYGRKIRNDLRAGTPLHLYLPGPHKGVWNEEGLAGSGGEVILCESLIDAMTFWVAGYRNVTASYGVQGFTADHLAAFKRYGIKRVLIAYDRDEAGERASAELAETLMAQGIACYRILLPKGMDANTYALSVTPAAKSLGLLIRKAQWLGEGKAPTPTSGPVDELAAAISVGQSETTVQAEPSLAAKEMDETAPLLPEPTTASPLPSIEGTADATALVLPPAGRARTLSQSEHELVLAQGDRRYRVRGWKKPLNPESLKVNLMVHRGDHFHVDSFDLYNAKARAAFVKAGAQELGEAEDVLKHDLGRVLLAVEAAQESELAGAMAKDERAVLSDEERTAALELLRDPDLVTRILADFASTGIIGEEVNVLTAYLACVSRLLDRPLAVLVQSSSAAGKSALMDAVLALMPGGAQVRYSAMTGQSLFYMGEVGLKHRILAIAEEEGASSASYALKLLQSEGEVTIASTGKDASTGQLVTHQYRVEGPVMLFLTTTAIDIDEELMNRCLVLSVNESRAQTQAIHALQRGRETLAGLLAREDAAAIKMLHRNAQGLLGGVHVVNPFADALTFLDDKTRTRRDHMKYLTLIRAIALLHQHQRRVKTVASNGQTLRYIEVEPSDIGLANRLAHEVLGRTLDELPPQTRNLLGQVHRWVGEQCVSQAIRRAEFRFTRAQVRSVTGWGDTQAKLHLSRLAELEYLLIHRVKGGQAYEYELLYDGEGVDENGATTPFVLGLSGLNHAYDGNRSGQSADQSGRGRPSVGGWSGGGRRDKTSGDTQKSWLKEECVPESPETHFMGESATVPSYTHNGSGDPLSSLAASAIGA
jgi:DNA primase